MVVQLTSYTQKVLITKTIQVEGIKTIQFTVLDLYTGMQRRIKLVVIPDSYHHPQVHPQQFFGHTPQVALLCLPLLLNQWQSQPTKMRKSISLKSAHMSFGCTRLGPLEWNLGAPIPQFVCLIYQSIELIFSSIFDSMPQMQKNNSTVKSRFSNSRDRIPKHIQFCVTKYKQKLKRTRRWLLEDNLH